MENMTEILVETVYSINTPSESILRELLLDSIGPRKKTK